LKVVQPGDLDKARDWVLGLQESFGAMFGVSESLSVSGDGWSTYGSEVDELPTATTYEVPDGESPISVPRTGY